MGLSEDVRALILHLCDIILSSLLTHFPAKVPPWTWTGQTGGLTVFVSFPPLGATLKNKVHENKFEGLQRQLMPAGHKAIFLTLSHLETQRLPLTLSKVLQQEGMELRCDFDAKNIS